MNRLCKAASKAACEKFFDTLRRGTYQEGFIDGAEWQVRQFERKEHDIATAAMLIGADMAKPKWISAEYDLPCNHKELIDTSIKIRTAPVIALMENGECAILKMYCEKDFWGPDFWHWTLHARVKYWMPVPKLPKGDEE